MELLGRIVVVCLPFEEIGKLFSRVAVQFCIPSINIRSSNFSADSSVLGIISVFNFSHSNRVTVVSHCAFNLYFPNSYQCWTSFQVLIWHPYIFFSGVPVHVLCPFLKWAVYFLIVEFWEFFVYSVYGCNLQVFPPILQLPFHSFNRVFLREKEYNFVEIQFKKFFLVFLTD